MLGAAAAVVIAAAVFMTIRRNYEPGYLNSIFQMKNENMPLFLQYAYMYIANNYSNFNCLTQALQQGLSRAHLWIKAAVSGVCTYRIEICFSCVSCL